MSKQRKWTMGPYNGWSPEERLASVPIQREAIRTGVLAKPDTCSICGFNAANQPRSSNSVWLHDERYDRPLEAYAICRSCHGSLHRRFEDPGVWLAIVHRHGGDGSSWFEQLSMDPRSQHRPFNETYPQGLPAPQKKGEACAR